MSRIITVGMALLVALVGAFPAAAEAESFVTRPAPAALQVFATE